MKISPKFSLDMLYPFCHSAAGLIEEVVSFMNALPSKHIRRRNRRRSSRLGPGVFCAGDE
jgi:hypothetical protein